MIREELKATRHKTDPTADREATTSLFFVKLQHFLHMM